MSIPRSLQLPTGVTRRIIDTARGPFATLQAEPDPAGPIGAPVVLVPGYTGSKEDFLAVLAPLAAAGHRAVAIDLRGQYETPGPDDPTAYELEELAADVLAVMDAVGGSAHLVGHSFGGFVTRAACALAVTDPRASVGSLVLMDSGPGEVTGEGTRNNLGMLAGALPMLDMETIWAAKRAIEQGRGDPVQAPEIEDFLHARFVTTHPVSLTVAAAQLSAVEDRVAALSELEVPVLVLYGEGEDVWSPTEIAAMAERLGAEAYVVAGAGHSPAVDDPAATAAALIDFWARLPA